MGQYWGQQRAPLSRATQAVRHGSQLPHYQLLVTLETRAQVVLGLCLPALGGPSPLVLAGLVG